MVDSQWLSPVTLTGAAVTLEPLLPSDGGSLAIAAADGELWNLWYTSVPGPESVVGYVQAALAEQAAGRALPFVVRHNETGQIIGTTRYCNVDKQHQRLEIGYTWYARSHQRSVVNTECKYLMLCHAFEELAAIAVEFRTHWHNLASRNAIARLGAKQDGVLRNHQRMADGSYRDTVVFSIINHEWLAVKASLRHKLMLRG